MSLAFLAAAFNDLAALLGLRVSLIRFLIALICALPVSLGAANVPTGTSRHVYNAVILCLKDNLSSQIYL